MSLTPVLKKLLTITLIISVVTLLTACDSSSSNDIENLDGQLTVEVQGPPGQSFFFSYQTWDGEELEVGTSTNQIPDDGVFSTPLDPGNYEGVEVRTEFFGDETPDVILRLLNEGDVVGETNTPAEDGSLIIRVGDFSES